MTLNTKSLQPPIPGSNSSKYLSESLDKAAKLQNNGVTPEADKTILEFVFNKSGHKDLMSTAVDQTGSKGVDAVKINYEGICDPTLRNIGVPPSQLGAFNNLIQGVKEIDQ
jgi:filamentous hemagglutinin